MDRLYVLFDETCGFCVQCAKWLASQRAYVPLVLMPSGAAKTKARFPSLTGTKDELTVVDERGGVYRGSRAWIMTLWALEPYRGWSKRLATPALMPLARNAFELVSSHRKGISRLLGLKGQELETTLRTAVDGPRCADGECAKHCASCGRVLPPTAKRCGWCGRWIDATRPAASPG